MDRKYKTVDTVRVYQSSKDGPLLTTIHRKAYSYAGMDYYAYLGRTYPAFVYLSKERELVYILLDQPLKELS
jgi:hypothetical protein